MRGNVTTRFQSCPKSARFGTCWNETEPQEPQLAPCRLYVNDTTVVNVDSVGTKVTVNPRALMPGATYTVHVGDGVFELKEDGTLKSEYFRLRVMVPHDLSQVTCSEDGDTHAHRTVSFKLSFPSPIFPLGGSLSVGPYMYNASDLDFVLTANDAGHPDSSSQYVAIVDPRVDGKDTLPQDSDFVVATAGDAFENLPAGELCRFATYWEETIPPRLIEVGPLGAFTAWGLVSADHLYTAITLRSLRR